MSEFDGGKGHINSVPFHQNLCQAFPIKSRYHNYETGGGEGAFIISCGGELIQHSLELQLKLNSCSISQIDLQKNQIGKCSCTC